MSIPPELIDADAAKVVHRLTRGNFEAYLVGGCVRDLLLGRKPKDFDIATSATPPEIKALFRNCRIIGRRFRLAHIFFGSKIIETSTFRANPREGELPELDGDGEETEAELLIRRDNVFGNAEEDARRRDFTINGLFYDLDEARVIDYVDGLPDLQKRTIRTIGDPQIRFREDPVRILRAIKFAARLDFNIDEAAWAAILQHKGEIAKCAAPRVLEEIYRLLRGGAARRSFELLMETGVLEVLIDAVHGHIVATPALKAELLAALDQLDLLVQAGGTPSNALLISVLVAPLLREVLYGVAGDQPVEPGQADPYLAIEEQLRPVLLSMRASRRDSEWARQILMAQRRLMPSKRRRSRPMALVRREWFAEAVQLLKLMHPRPEGELADELATEIERWERLQKDEAHVRPGGTDARDGRGDRQRITHGPGTAGAESEPVKRKRRRRGGRRHRGTPVSSSTVDTKLPPAPTGGMAD